MSGKLYIVGTPIGNLEDITLRALKTLQTVDFIAAEDTRVTSKLLNHFNIKKPMTSYFEHNKHEKGNIICQKIQSGENCALVSDAGMPLISDPGEELVKQCYNLKIDIKVVPGPNAAISALCLSGISSGRFTFEGFLSKNKKNRVNHLKLLENEHRTMIFYESPHKLLSTLKDFYNFFGDRQIAIARELTKIHEEVKTMAISEAIDFYSNGAKGEFVIIVPGATTSTENPNYSIDKAVEIALNYEKDGEAKPIAAKKASKITGFNKSEIYKIMSKQQTKGTKSTPI